ncbi:MAG: OsmC family protein [Chloroflexi bacterium]|nr:OsmC family protein [Chloroflexota bacterium]
MTLRLYADKKGWSLGSITVELSHERVHARDCAECDERDDAMLDVVRSHIVVRGDLDGAQSARLLQIAKRCPVHRTLEGGPTILTELDAVAG